ncbi:lasso peptide biosynthesis protein [Sulfurovum sp.]
MKDEDAEEKMKAHAWSECGGIIITGAKGHEEYTVLSVFGWEKR